MIRLLNPFGSLKVPFDGELVLRGYGDGDADALNAIFVSRDVNEFLAFEPTTTAESRKYYSDARKSGQLPVVAVLDGRVVGSISLRPERGRNAHVTGFGIMFSPGVFGKGVAEACMRALFVWWKKQGFELVRSGVHSGNPRARAFYKKLGFKEVGAVKKFVKFADGSYDDEVIIVKRL